LAYMKLCGKEQFSTMNEEQNVEGMIGEVGAI
jgi:hypothetical protein